MNYAATFDTLSIAQHLKSSGFSEPQATAIVGAIREGRTADIDELVTKSDLKVDLAELKAELLKWYVGIAMFQTITFLGGIIAIAKIFHP